MNLQARNLTIGTHSDDVAQLHSVLRRLGLTIPDDELRQAYFGPGTRAAVVAFQRAHNLAEHGIVDAQTAAALAQTVAAAPLAGAASPAPSQPTILSARPTPGVAPADPVPAPTQPAGAGSDSNAAGGTSQPAAGASAPAPGQGSGSPASAPPAGEPTPPAAGSPPTGGSAGAPPAAGGPPAPGTAGDAGAYVVEGHVSLSDNTPLAGVAVRAFNLAVGRAPTVIGERAVRTDAQGAYAIRYPASTFARTKTAALLVRVLDAQGNILASSPSICQPGAQTTCDLAVDAAAAGVPSEYERLIQVLTPHLNDVEVSGAAAPSVVDRLAVLKPEDLDLLAKCIGLGRETLALLVSAAQLQQQARAANASVPAAGFYGLAREGLGTDPAAMLRRGAVAIHTALTQAISDNIIPRSLASGLDDVMAGLQRLVIQAALTNSPGGMHPLADLLSLSIPADKQAILLGLYGANQGTIEQFWATVRKNPAFQAPGLVDDIQLTLKLNLITLGHLPLVQALRQTYRITSLRDLVRLSPAQWLDLLNKQVNGQVVGVPDGIPGASSKEQAATYVDGIVQTLQLAFPTDAVAVTVAQSPAIGMGTGTRQNVLQFFANAPDFDLTSSRVDDYVQQKGAGIFQGIDATSRAQVVEQVKRVQRVYNVSPSADAMAALLARGYDSAHSIATTPRSIFVQQMRQALGGTGAAQQVYEKARVVHATMLHVVLTINDRLHGVRPAALDAGAPSSSAQSPANAALGNNGYALRLTSTGAEVALAGTSPSIQPLDLSQYPSLQKLFGSMDYCDCEDCRSVLSPAAYLVDLLDMLDPNPNPNPTLPKPIDVLFSRRPDLQYIPLTCENTNTPLPSIDLVNEILETWIASSTHDVSTAGANDTGEATAAELRASPQYVLSTVYDTSPLGPLAKTIYPFPLPFDLPVETARVYLQFMGSSLYGVMSAFQPPDASTKEQAQRTQAGAAEYLKLTPEEYWLITGQDFSGTAVSPTYALKDYYGYSPDGSASNAQVSSLLTHTGLSMAELIQLLGMRTVNPLAPSQQMLQAYVAQQVAATQVKLGPSYKTPNLSLIEYCLINGTTAPKGADPGDWSAAVSWVQTYAPTELTTWKQLSALGGAIVIAGDPADTTAMYLEHQDGSVLATWEWQWLYYFIRLWRKLGWTLTDLDTALASWLIPDRSTATGADLAKALPQLSVAAQISDRLKLSVADALALWVPFTSGTDGISPLYTKLFLNKAVQRVDDVFQPTWDDQVLTSAPVISNHLPALRAAFRVTEDDVTALVTFMGKSVTDTLDLPTLSNLYRYVVLGRGLKLRIPDLLSLVTLWGGEMAVFGKAGKQEPPSTLRFVQSASTISSSGFSVPELDYLYRQITTPRTTFAPDPSTIGTTAQALRSALLQVPTETATDPTGAVLSAQMQPNFSGDQISQLLQILGGTDEYLVALKTTLTYDSTAKITSGGGQAVYALTMTLPPALAFPRVGYVPQNTGASLYIRGALSQGDMQGAGTFTSSDPTNYTNYVLPALNDASGPYNAPRTFLQQPALMPLLDTGQPGSNSAQDAIDYILNQPHTPEEKYEFVLSRYRTTLSWFGAVDQILGTALKLDAATTDTLLQTILTSTTLPNTPAMYDAVALATPGLNRISNGKAGSTSAIDPAVAFDGTVVALPAGTTTATWSGVVLPSGDDAYTFFVRAAPGVSVQLVVDTQPLTTTTPTAINSAIPGSQPGEVSAKSPTALSAGQPCYIQLKVDAPSGGSLSIVELRWSGTTGAKASVPSAALYPTGVLETFSPTYLLASKAALLVSGFHLTSDELVYLWTHRTDFATFDPNKLPLNRGVPATVDQDAPPLFQWWLRLRAYASLRDSLPAGGATRLLGVFAAAASTTSTALSDAQAAFITLTGWDPTVLAALVLNFGLAASDLQTEVWPARLQTCMQVIQSTGASPAQLFGWSKTAVQAGASNAGLTMADADAIKKVAKTGYDDDAWLKVAESLNDPLRQRQRDALVAYCLAILSQPPKQGGINAQTADDLFDYFLIDVEMEPCMLTSRIKQAISSVQTFVQRCLLNLEQSNVLPSAIDPDDWAWKSRNAIWQAAREVFLWPENYMVPELRDDKSPFFEDLESQLLQGEVTADNVEAAFLSYLTALDEVKQLDICGLYWQDTDPDTGDTVNILHVFGRTNDLPHVYYYRQLVGYTTWTPWEKLQVDIEGDHLIPVVWNRRLHIFWPIFTQNTKSNDGPPDPNDVRSPAISKVYWDIRLAWSEYAQGKWQPKHVSNAVFSHPDVTTHDYQNLLLPVVPSNGQTTSRWYLDKRYDILGDLYAPSTYAFKAIVGSEGGLIIRIYQAAPPDMQLQWGGDYAYLLVSLGSTRKPCASICDFAFTGCGGEVQLQPPPSCVIEPAPNTAIDHEMFEEQSGGNSLSLFVGAFGDEPTVNPSDEKPYAYFTKTPSTYEVLYPHQYLQFALQAPFYCQDQQRSYCVLPSPNTSILARLAQVDHIEVFTTPAISKMPGLMNPIVGPGVAGSVGSGAGAIAGRVQLTSVGAASLGWLPQQPSVALGRADSAGPRLQLTAGRSQTGSATMTSGSQVAVANPAAQGAIYQVPIVPGRLPRMVPQPVNSRLQFVTHYHPYVCDFIKALDRYGIKGLLRPDAQSPYPDMQSPYVSPAMGFDVEYNPVLANVDVSRTWESVDFGYQLGTGATPNYSGQPIEGYGTYSLYNWELFFHAPLLLAERLSQNQQFDQARTWFHYIFDPTDSAQQYWHFLPFLNNTAAPDQSIQTLLESLDSSNSAYASEQQAVVDQINQWTRDPFVPYAVARLRIVAYQKNVVMKYLDNLIAWGDQLFQQDTIETINEATQLYILAARLLGPRPQETPRHTQDNPQTYASLRAGNDPQHPGLDQFANALVGMENDFPFAVTPTTTNGGSAILSLGKTLYFCIPPNSQMLGYWDTVADRLFKIRNCLNIQGVAQQLPLFDPPIDPMLLVQAAAQGLSLSVVLGDLSAPLPYYRFSYLLPKALELCAQVQSLGAALLAAQEKADAEQLALTRASQETEMLRDYMRRIKQQQILDAQATVDALTKTQVTTQFRHDHYDGLITAGLSGGEIAYLALISIAAGLGLGAQVLELIAAAITPIPDATAGGAGMASPVAVAHVAGGSKAASAVSASARAVNMFAALTRDASSLVATTAGYDRRQQDWELQRDLAAKELDQIQKQIDGANIRLQIANWELENHDKQTDNAAFVEDFLRTKYTSQQLYQWMHDQLATVYYQAYTLAYDIAKKAERAYRFERGLLDSNFIQFGTWDSQHDGLLAGEKLHLALQQMEQAYLNQNSRDYEITKSISLALLDPQALIQLKEIGSCDIALPEELFDADYPGHYMRRIKTVALTIPCVVGPYTSINCTLTLNSNSTRINANAAGPDGTYAPSTDSDDDRFVNNFAATQSIATSHGQNDTGLFELNFRDERYLPFEGAGVISRWHVDLPRENNSFDFNTITDVILRLQYTARDGGKTLAGAARASLQSDPIASSGARLFSAKHEFAASWIQFTSAPKTAQLQLDFSKERFPYQVRNKTVQIDKIDLHLLLDGTTSGGTAPTVTLSHTGSPADPLSIPLKTQGKDANGYTLYWSGSLGTAATSGDYPTGALQGTQANPWALSISALPQGVVDLLVVCEYSWT